MKTLCFAAALLVALGCQAGGVDDEIARLETSLDTLQAADLPKDVLELIPAQRAALERAKKATSPEYRLYRLRDPFVGIETLTFLAAKKESGASLESFRKLWESQRARFEATPQKARGSLLQRGLSESASTRALRLFHASLPYAKASAPWSGVYYLGEAEGNLRFREFLQSQPSESVEASPAASSVAAQLDALESITQTFFAGDVTNQALIAVSVRLKEARELLDAGRIDGAALLAVEARAALSRRGGPRGSYPQQASRQQDSLGAFVSAWAADEEPPMREALRDEVLPFYLALHAPVTARTAPPPASVKVTLVRWPYT